MRKTYLCLIAIIVIVTSSCSDSTEVLNETINISYGDMVHPDSISVDKHVMGTRSSNDSDDFDKYEQGYDDVNLGSNMKLLLSSTIASKMGLNANTVYITRYETYYKIVNLNGKDFYDDVLYEECGLREKKEIDGSYLSYTDRGYDIGNMSSKYVELKTHLIHVVSDLSGNSMNIYYPCTPSQIKWHYILF